jgi:hypothetical protein
MGTRADFYVGRGTTAEWLGSIAWDGYVEGITTRLLRATTERKYRNAVAAFFAGREDVTLPAMGWPWPWDDSRTTDYAYAFDGGHVWGSCFGHEWFDARKPEPEPDEDEDGSADRPQVAVFPTMDKRTWTLGPRSGVVVVTARGR